MRRRWLAAIGATLLVTTGASPVPVASSTVVLLVRHAERAPGTGDVPISDAGRARANDLVEISRVAGVQAIVTTQFTRTKQTAEPTATALGITPQVIGAQSDVARHASEVADAVKQHAGKVVLVVGHSNTIPAIVAALGGHRYPDLCEMEYDRLFTVLIDADGTVRTIRSGFGARTPVEANCAPMR